MAAGYVIYRGPSALGDGDIVVIACALERSRNSKTGHMVQTYILRADMHPVEAVKTGADDAICGDCKHRGVLGVGRSCYVTLAHGPSHVWRSLQRGVYPDADPAAVGLLLAGKAIRLGTYGDPAAAPIEVWQDLIRYAAAWTGYSHAWQKLGADWREMLMASADTLEEAWTAQDMGWRTFRVGVGAIYGEVRCPASAEAGKKTTCAECRACMGLSAKARAPIVIAPHGAGARYARERETV